jgi:hypothetical protein
MPKKNLNCATAPHLVWLANPSRSRNAKCGGGNPDVLNVGIMDVFVLELEERASNDTSASGRLYLTKPRRKNLAVQGNIYRNKSEDKIVYEVIVEAGLLPGGGDCSKSAPRLY